MGHRGRQRALSRDARDERHARIGYRHDPDRELPALRAMVHSCRHHAPRTAQQHRQLEQVRARDWFYEFELPDGSLRYEFVDLNNAGYPVAMQLRMFIEMHGAKYARPVKQKEGSDEDGDP